MATAYLFVQLLHALGSWQEAGARLSLGQRLLAKPVALVLADGLRSADLTIVVGRVLAYCIVIRP